MNYFFWLLLNIGVPLFGPVAMLATVAVSYGRTVAKRLIVESVKDGQLFWSAIAISAAAVYELITALDRAAVSVTIPFSGTTLIVSHKAFELALLPFLFFAFFGSLLVMLASLKSLEDVVENPNSRDDVLPPHAKTSIWLTAIAALCFAILHFLIG
jgi:hypothetical protein